MSRLSQQKLFNEIEEYERIHKIKRNQGGVIDGNGNPVDSVFTTSEITDIWEMIQEDWSKEEIINRIKNW